MDREVVDLYLDDIIPNRFQPREVFNEEALRELSASIKEHGVIQPIIVRKIGDKYEIIAGERRYKASTMAGLTKIPAIIRNLDDKEASKVALLENLQRKDLSAIEEARTYQKILELDSMTQEELGRTMGKSQAAIANKMRLLSLPDEVQEALLQDKISERHARSLLNLDSSEEQISMLKKIIDNRMTVRELDNEIKALKDDTIRISPPVIEPSSNILEQNQQNNSTASATINNDLIASYNLDSIPQPKDDALEILDDFNDGLDDNIDNKDVIETKEPVLTQPESDFEQINDLLRSPKIHSYTLKDAVSEIRNTTSKLENKGFDIRVEEMDFENTYQIVIKIEKDK